MDASQAIAFVEQNYPQYPQQQKYIIAQYVMQRAAAIKQQQMTQEAQDSGGGSVAGGVAGAVLPTAAAYGIDALLSGGAAQAPNIVSALSAPAGTFSAAAPAAASGGQVVLGGGAGATAEGLVAAGGQLGGGSGAAGTSTAAATGFPLVNAIPPLLAAAYMYKLGQGRADRIYDRTDENITSSKQLETQLPGFKDLTQEQKLGVLNQLKELNMLGTPSLKTKRESEATHTNYSQYAPGAMPGIFTGYAPKAARNSDYDRDKEQYKAYDDLRKTGTIHDILEKGNLTKGQREKYTQFLNYYNNIGGQQPMQGYKPTPQQIGQMQVPASAPEPTWQSGQGQPQPNLKPYYEGAPAGQYRAPDGVNTYTVTPDGQIRTTLMGVLSPQQQQAALTAWGVNASPAQPQGMIPSQQPQQPMQGYKPTPEQVQYLTPTLPVGSDPTPQQIQGVNPYQALANSPGNRVAYQPPANLGPWQVLQTFGGQKAVDQTRYFNEAIGQARNNPLANQPSYVPYQQPQAPKPQPQQTNTQIPRWAQNLSPDERAKYL